MGQASLFWANECVLVTRLQMEASRVGRVTKEIRGKYRTEEGMMFVQIYKVCCCAFMQVLKRMT